MTFHKCKWMLKECFKYNIITNNSIIGHPVNVIFFFFGKTNLHIIYFILILITWFHISFIIRILCIFTFNSISWFSIDTWILYRGLENGVSIIISDAYRRYVNLKCSSKSGSTSIDDVERHIKLISFAGRQVTFYKTFKVWL